MTLPQTSAADGVPIRAVIYAAKSTEDRHGSIPTQLDDCRAYADRHGWLVVGEFQDEGFSAYKGNRGPGFDEAKRTALRVAEQQGACVLIAQDADRFARGSGDAPGAADHLGELFFRMKRGGVSLYSVRSGELDLLRAVLEGERSTDESSRKRQSVRAGLARRKANGRPVGPIPFGYRVDRNLANPPREIDPALVDAVRRIFAMVEAGRSFGEVAKALNAEGVATKRGSRWSNRTVRDLVLNEAYAGRKGYDQIIEPERYDQIIANLTRLDPAAVQRRQGGRPPKDPSFFLRGVVFCRHCGNALWTRTYPNSHLRVYLCAHKRGGGGMCAAKPVRADLIEGHVLEHFGAFAGIGALAWIEEKEGDFRAEHAARATEVDRRRDAVAKLDRRLVQAHRKVDEALDADDDGLADVALRQVARIERDREAAEAALVQAESAAAELEGSEIDDALDYYNEVVELAARIASADSVAALAQLFPQVVAGIWVSVDDGMLHAEFEMRTPDHPSPNEGQRAVYLMQQAGPVWDNARRVTLPDTRPQADVGTGRNPR